MSSASLTSPPSPAQHRDIRAAGQPFKRDKDHSAKWLDGKRPLPGIRDLHVNLAPSGDEERWTKDSTPQQGKVRPRKQFSQAHSSYKTHANKTPRFGTRTWENGFAANRVSRKVEAQVEASSKSDISRSLLDLMPQHASTATSGIHTTVRTPSDDGVLTPFEFVGASPAKKGRTVGLGGLIEKAEELFLDKQTELMVKEDYEVLDADGESVVLKSEKKRKGSPKQKAATAEAKPVEEDDGFELI